MSNYGSIIPKEPKRAPSGSNKGKFQSSHAPQGGGGGLRAEKRQDKDGKLVTRWVKDSNDNGASSALSQARVSASATSKFPANVNWDSTSIGAAEGLAGSVAANLDDPDKLWQNFDFYTNMLESDHAYTAMVSMNENNVALRLRDAWLNKQGMTLADKNEYSQIGGDEGYLSYHDAHVALSKAGENAAHRVETNDPSLIKPRPLEEIIRPSSQGELKLSHDSRGNAVVDYMHDLPSLKEKMGTLAEDRVGRGENEDSAINDREFKEQFDAHSKKAYKAVDDSDLEFKEQFDEYSRRAYEAVPDLGDSIGERRTSETPKKIGGSTAAWSDMNPFKGWGRKK